MAAYEIEDPNTAAATYGQKAGSRRHSHSPEIPLKKRKPSKTYSFGQLDVFGATIYMDNGTAHIKTRVHPTAPTPPGK